MCVSRICEPSLCFYEIYVMLFGFSLLFHFICSLLRLDVNNIMLSLPTQQASICYDSRFSHRDLPKWHIRKYKGVKHLSFYNLLSVFSLRRQIRSPSQKYNSVFSSYIAPKLYLPHQASILHTANLFISKYSIVIPDENFCCGLSREHVMYARSSHS